MVYTYLEPVFKVLILILMKILQAEAKKHKDWYCTDWYKLRGQSRFSFSDEIPFQIS